MSTCDHRKRPHPPSILVKKMIALQTTGGDSPLSSVLGSISHRSPVHPSIQIQPKNGVSGKYSQTPCSPQISWSSHTVAVVKYNITDQLSFYNQNRLHNYNLPIVLRFTLCSHLYSMSFQQQKISQIPGPKVLGRTATFLFSAVGVSPTGCSFTSPQYQSVWAK